MYQVPHKQHGGTEAWCQGVSGRESCVPYQVNAVISQGMGGEVVGRREGRKEVMVSVGPGQGPCSSSFMSAGPGLLISPPQSFTRIRPQHTVRSQ